MRWSREAEGRLSQAEKAGMICQVLSEPDQRYDQWRLEYGGLELALTATATDLARRGRPLPLFCRPVARESRFYDRSASGVQRYGSFRDCLWSRNA